MILFIGPLADSVAAHLMLLMQSREIEFLPLDPRTFGSEWDIAWWTEDGEVRGYVKLDDDSRVDLRDVCAVWAHMIAIPQRPEDEGAQIDQAAYACAIALAAFSDCFPGLVYSRPATAASNGVKPYQAQIIAEHGFEPIRTLITNRPEEARRFCESLNGEVIFKSISGIRSIVRRIAEEDFERMELLPNCPTQFQEFIPGTDIRVHAAGDRLLATEIGCSTDDYRYVPADMERVMRAISLPAKIAEQCRSLMKAMDMSIGGIDLRRAPDGRYYCFEVNPNPGFIFYEQYTGQRIGDAFLDMAIDDLGTLSGAAG